MEPVCNMGGPARASSFLPKELGFHKRESIPEQTSRRCTSHGTALLYIRPCDRRRQSGLRPRH